MSMEELLCMFWLAAWHVIFFFILVPWRERRRRIRFTRISIPLVRRIYPQLIAEKICNVQPMLEPTALNYYLKYRYATGKEEDRQVNTECW